MQFSSKFLQILSWVFFTFLIFLSSSSFAAFDSEIQLICGRPKYNLNSTVSISLVPNFVKVLEVVQQQISDNNQGHASSMLLSPNVFALAQCYDDLSSLDCKLCISQCRVKLPRCLPNSAARIYLDGCFLRYDNYSFFQEAVNPLYDYVNCTRPSGVSIDESLHSEFKKKVEDVIENVTQLALENGNFSTIEAKEGPVPAYALAQCWDSLTYGQCRECLTLAGSDLRQCAPGPEGHALYTGCYLRYSTLKFFNTSSEGNNSDGYNPGVIGAIALAAVAFFALACFGAYIVYERLSKGKKDQQSLRPFAANSSLNFNYEVLEKATDYFSDDKKLGQGGSGSVFKGTLPDGSIVAVKRLVYNTRQWVDQFFNEVNLISGIQHKNIVGLIGCSIEGPESLLVYEYVPNRSLDQILFTNNTEQILSWEQRYEIILGTAEGLAYLHGGSGVKIIHRDIKTSNILLDEDLTPKIADFGLARCCATNDSHISTGIAGTLGYMAPEYLVQGKLTEKADVYGFGVLIIEIVSGKKNGVFAQGSSSVLHNVWKHYKARTLAQAIDSRIRDSNRENEVENVLQIGLVCTQASSSLRPTMSQVVQMLRDANCELPTPKQPPFLNASVLTADGSTENSITRVSLSENSSLSSNVQTMYFFDTS